MMPRNSQRLQGFTLVETVIAAGVAAVILAAVVLGGVSFLNVFNATDEYYKSNADQSRVLDSIAVDLRCALSGTISNSGQTLSLTLPGYLNYAGDPPVPQTPAWSGTSVTYSGTTSVSYSVLGAAPNQSIIRTITTTSGTTTSTTSTASLTAFPENYQILFFDPAGSSTTTIGGGGLHSVGVQITFAPKYNRLNLSDARAGTITTATLTLRN